MVHDRYLKVTKFCDTLNLTILHLTKLVHAKFRNSTCFAIELVTLAVDFVPLAVEFGTFAVEFVHVAVKFVAFALCFRISRACTNFCPY